MSSVVGGIQVAVVFVWLGMVLGISFLETPLKFRAPGMTVPLGVAIGRLVFRALNAIECVFAVALIVCAALGAVADTALTVWVLVTLCVILFAGAFVLRPLMDRRVRTGAASDGLPRNRLHVWYVLLEALKVAGLIVLGVVYLRA